MIEITRCDRCITVSGHAGYAPHGQDIVCAAVSVLANNLIASIEELTADSIEYEIDSGEIIIKFRNLTDEASLLVSSFFVGVEAVAAAYPDCVRIE
jgi:uncharacterized protein YsxB (DUF464 family)